MARQEQWYDKEALIKFETPSKISVVAASNSGKTYFVSKLLEHSNGMFKNDFKYTLPLRKRISIHL